MDVGALRVELRIRGVRSLKEKRRVMKRIIADVGAAHPVAVAEVDYQELSDWAACIVDTRNAMAEIETTEGQVWKA